MTSQVSSSGNHLIDWWCAVGLECSHKCLIVKKKDRVSHLATTSISSAITSNVEESWHSIPFSSHGFSWLVGSKAVPHIWWSVWLGSLCYRMENRKEVTYRHPHQHQHHHHRNIIVIYIVIIYAENQAWHRFLADPETELQRRRFYITISTVVDMLKKTLCYHSLSNRTTSTIIITTHRQRRRRRLKYVYRYQRPLDSSSFSSSSCMAFCCLALVCSWYRILARTWSDLPRRGPMKLLFFFFFFSFFFLFPAEIHSLHGTWDPHGFFLSLNQLRSCCSSSRSSSTLVLVVGVTTTLVRLFSVFSIALLVVVLMIIIIFFFSHSL